MGDRMQDMWRGMQQSENGRDALFGKQQQQQQQDGDGTSLWGSAPHAAEGGGFMFNAERTSEGASLFDFPGNPSLSTRYSSILLAGDEDRGASQSEGHYDIDDDDDDDDVDMRDVTPNRDRVRHAEAAAPAAKPAIIPRVAFAPLRRSNEKAIPSQSRTSDDSSNGSSIESTTQQNANGTAIPSNLNMMAIFGQMKAKQAAEAQHNSVYQDPITASILANKLSIASEPVTPQSTAKPFVFKDATEEVTSEVTLASARARAEAAAQKENASAPKSAPRKPGLAVASGGRKPGLSVKPAESVMSTPSLRPRQDRSVSPPQETKKEIAPPAVEPEPQQPRRRGLGVLSVAATPARPPASLEPAPSVQAHADVQQPPPAAAPVQRHHPRVEATPHARRPATGHSVIPGSSIVKRTQGSHEYDAHASDGRYIRVVNGHQYKQLELIGAGGSSRVYRVRSLADQQTYALKSVPLRMPNTRPIDPSIIKGYRDEIELLQRLQETCSEYVVNLMDTETTSERIYMVMELGDKDFAELLCERAHKRFNMNTIRDYWEQMLQCLNAIHSAKIVHADVKPANFLMVRGQLKIIDFGIAKAIPSDTVNISRDTNIGTLSYMSPEALNGPGASGKIKFGRASDVWALGCILYQMIYGNSPFSMESPMLTHVAITGTYEPPYPAVPRGALAIATVQNCLQRNHTQRPTVEQLLKHPFVNPEANVPADMMERWVAQTKNAPVQ
ncbi:Serine/threonine kinase mps1 [Sorochytrium milnesiophthora]